MVLFHRRWQQTAQENWTNVSLHFYYTFYFSELSYSEVETITSTSFWDWHWVGNNMPMLSIRHIPGIVLFPYKCLEIYRKLVLDQCYHLNHRGANWSSKKGSQLPRITQLAWIAAEIWNQVQVALKPLLYPSPSPISFFPFLANLLGMWDVSFLTRDWTCAPALEAQSLNHWTTGKVPPLSPCWHQSA